MPAQTRSQQPLLGTVLIVGGCGFFGYHLTSHLLRDDDCGEIYILDRHVVHNRHVGPIYTNGSVSDSEAVRSLVQKIKPRVIFHAASPPADLPVHRQHEFHDTNVTGTEVLLTVALECDSVQALVYTSSMDVYANPPYDNVNEQHALWREDDRSDEYNRTKAIADRLVLTANSPQLRTVALRPGHMYGERHTQGLPQILDMCTGNMPLVQLGRGKNLMEVVSAANTVTAHVLAAKALLDPSRANGKVDGEAFNVSDGAPVPFWHHVRVIWRVVRGEDALKWVIVVPAWVMKVVVFLAQWLFWIFTMGTVTPPTAVKATAMNYCLYDMTCNIDKARERLLFDPKADHDAVMEQCVRWELERRQATTTNTEVGR